MGAWPCFEPFDLARRSGKGKTPTLNEPTGVMGVGDDHGIAFMRAASRLKAPAPLISFNGYHSGVQHRRFADEGRNERAWVDDAGLGVGYRVLIRGHQAIGQRAAGEQTRLSGLFLVGGR